MSGYEFQPDAIADVDGILEFLEVERSAPQAADAWFAEFRRKCGSYARQPLMGDIRDDLGDDVRSFVVRKTYVVVYRPVEDGIEVLRVFHGARDYGRLFGE